MGRRLPWLCRIARLPQRGRPGWSDQARLRRRRRLSDATTATSTATTGTDVPVPKDGSLRSAPTEQSSSVRVVSGGMPRRRPSRHRMPARRTRHRDRPTTRARPVARAKPKGSDRTAAKPTTTRAPAPLSAAADAKHDATLPVTATTEQTTDAVNRLTDVVADPIERTGGAASLRYRLDAVIGSRHAEPAVAKSTTWVVS